MVWLAWTNVEARHYEAALPATIGAAGIVTWGSDAGLVAALVGFRREACGGIMFELRDETLKAVERHGLAFLRSARQGRADQPRGFPPRLRTLADDARAPSWTSEGMWPRLHCVGRRWSGLGTRILRAATEPGSFHTKAPESELLVIPSLGLAVLTYFG